MNQNAFLEYPIHDGFELLQSIRCNLTFRAMAIEQYEALRRSGSYRSRYWTIPESHSFVIPAFDAYEYQIKCVPRAAIWGFIFTNEAGSPGPFSFNVREACTDVPLWSEVIRADTFNGNGQQFLSALLVIPSPGLVTVEIASQQATDANGCQLILCGGEPTGEFECA